MENMYIAKSNPIQTIQEHTDELLNQLKTLKSIYGEKIKFIDWEILRLSCIYHDLGKMNSKFQNKIMKAQKLNKKLEDITGINDEVPHGYLSVAFLQRKELKKIYGDDELKILYQSIYYHHVREKEKNEDNIKATVKGELINYFKEFQYDKLPEGREMYSSSSRYTSNRISMGDIDFDNLEDDYEEQEKLNLAYRYVVNKGLLNKIDFAASSNKDVIVELENKELELKVKELIEGFGAMNNLQEFMYKHNNENIISVASTGIGKTEAGLLWIGDNKGFFILPLRVSINAIYKRILEKIKFPKELTGLLHSETLSEYVKMSDVEVDLDYVERTKQLSLPLTICTLDQLVDFIFKYEGYELKLATLSYSKIVIDEIQMFSPQLVAFLITALRYINDVGGKFAILTATFPPIFEYFMKRELGEKAYIKAEKSFIKLNSKGKSILRHRASVLEKSIDVDDIIDKHHNKKVLVIVNTVKTAQDLYDEIVNRNIQCDVNLFHSQFIKRDRRKKEAEILCMGEKDNDDTGIWITTQVVEASVDIDFDILFTELSDICGLFQRMGRVYRGRDYNSEQSNIYIYTGGDVKPSGISEKVGKGIIDYDIFKLSKEAIAGWSHKEISEEYKMKLVEDIYTVSNLKKSNYFKIIKETLEDLKHIEDYSIEKSNIDLRGINSKTIMPKAIYDANKEEIEEIIEMLNDKNSKYTVSDSIKLKDKIMDLTVSIDSRKYKVLEKAGRIKNRIVINKYNEIIIGDTEYTYEKGTRIEKEKKGFDEEEQFL